jgi:RimJ/RimL family protein N-acetyltransferase
MIRKATPSDFDFIYNLYMHPEINKYLLYEMMDSDAFRPVYNDLLSKEVKYIYEHENVPAGMFKLVPYTYRASHIAYLGGLAIHPGFSGKGYGLSMMQEIKDHTKEHGFLRIELSVAEINKKAIRLYEKAGFEKEGILKKYTFLKFEQIFLDEILMAYLFI